jgi:signal transduction histidine kinase
MTPRSDYSWLKLAGVFAPAIVLVGSLLIAFPSQPAATGLPGADGEVTFFADAGRGLDFAAVRELPVDAWQPWLDPARSLPGRGAWWTRVTLRNPSGRAWHGVLAARGFFSDHVEAWMREDDHWEQEALGEATPARERPMRGREAALPVTVPARGEAVVYVRSADYFVVWSGWLWWRDAGDFQANVTRSWLGEAAYFGALLALLGYNALLWWRLRLDDIGFYALHAATVAVFMLLARGVPSVLGWTIASPALETALAVTLALSAYFLTRFARAFLETARWLPRADRVMRGVGRAMLVLSAVGLTTAWGSRAHAFALAVGADALVHIVWFGLALAAWRAGAAPARFFVRSFGCLFAGSLVAMATWWWHMGPEVPMGGVMLGSALEMLLLSLAVADRFAQAQREKTAAQERLATETERRRALQEAYADELEAEVRDRTHELEQANADKDRMLAVIGHDLRSPLAGLMRAAEAETGTFARETMRTGRALLLLIEDLVLWARLRAGTRQIAPHPAANVVAPAVTLHRALAASGGVELVVDMPEELRVETDLVLTQTLVRNLLANALKFAETRVVLRVTRVVDGGVRVTIANDGPPLPPAVAARMATGENEPLTATGGLGLRLCREICRALGLRLEAGVAPDGDTEFGCTLREAATMEQILQ